MTLISTIVIALLFSQTCLARSRTANGPTSSRFQYPFNEQVYTLSIVLSNTDIDDSKLAEIIDDAQQNIPENATYQFPAPIRLQINPVHTAGLGLSDIMKQLFCSPQSKGTNAVFFLVDHKTSTSHNPVLLSNFMAMLGNHIGLPAIAWSSSIVELETTKNNPSMILLAPSIRSQARSIFAFLRKFLPQRKVSILISTRAPGFEHFVNQLRELADSDEQGRRYSRFEFDSHQHHMSSRFIQLVQMDNSSIEGVRKELIYLRDNTDTRVFVTYSDHYVTDKVLEEAHLLGMTTSDFIWICGKPAFMDPAPQNYAPGVIAATYNTSLEVQIGALKTAVRIWAESVRRLVALSKPGDHLSPTISCTRFTMPKWQHGELFNDILRRRLAKMKSTNQLTELNDITLHALLMSRKWSPIGHWREVGGLEIVNHKWMRRFDREIVRYNQQKSTFLKIVTLDEPPYVAYEWPNPVNGQCAKNAVPCRLASDLGHSHIIASDIGEYSTFNRANDTAIQVCCIGYVIDLLRRLAQDVGFSFELFEVADRKWGSIDPTTGKWNGLVSAILNGTADMVATSLKVNTDRSSAIDFSVPFYQTGVTILVRVREGVVSSVAFLEPFSVETWLVVFLGLVNACALFIFFFENFRKIIRTSDEEVEEFAAAKTSHKTSSLFGSFWLVLSMLFNAAMKTDTPRSVAGRFVANIWAFFCVIFMSSFMANLAAFMITKEEFYDFSGIDDFRLKNPYTKNPPWRYATIPHGATEQLLRTNFPEMHEYMRQFARTDVDEGVEAVQKGELDAFIYDASVLSYKAGRDKNCQLRTVGKWYAPTGYGFGFPKSSKWLHNINKYILDYQVSGYLQHLEDFWLSSSCKQHFQKEVHKSTELGIANLTSVFAILAIALILCGAFFVIEHIYIRTCRTKLKFRSAAWRLITPSLGRVLSFRATAIGAFTMAKESNCPNPRCKFQHQLLQSRLEKAKNRVQQLESEKQSNIKELVEEARVSICRARSVPVAQFGHSTSDIGAKNICILGDDNEAQ